MLNDAMRLAQTVRSMRPVVPARVFEISRRFYIDLGFQPHTLTDKLVEMRLGTFAFILQDYYVQQWADNLVMHMGVSDMNLWWDRIVALDLPSRYGVKSPGPPRLEDWGLVASVIDPSGVLWRIVEEDTAKWGPMSNKPVAERLQVKGDRRLAVIGASAMLEKTVGASKARADLAKADVVLLFAADRAGLDASLPNALKKMTAAAILWVAYPKLSSKLAADLSRDVIHALAPKHGLDTVSQIAIDEDWSALRLKRVNRGPQK